MTIGKHAHGLRGFPTPDYPADDESYLLFYFPDGLWAQYLLGALRALVYEYNWYEAGGMMPDEASEAFRLIIQEAPYNLLTDTTPTPFWDEDTDVDDDFPADAQPWYGTVSDPTVSQDELTFVENALVWAFTGFIAAATFEVGAAPAILFNTVAKKMVIANRRGDIGAIIRIWIDGSMAAEVDTSSYTEGDVIRTTIIGNPDLSTHDLAIVQVS